MSEVGKAAYEIAQKKQEKVPAIELSRAMGTQISKLLEDTIKTHEKEKRLYFIKILFRKHRSLPPNHIHCQVIAPYYAKPAADYDETVFSMNNNTGELKYLWSIPDEESCEYILANSSSLPEEQKQLYEFVKLFSEGKLN